MDSGLAELADYLGLLSGHVRVLVVDGSDEDLFAAHARAFPAGVFHCRPKHPECRNGKVDGVRYTPQQLDQVGALLGDADVVRPQNYFAPPSVLSPALPSALPSALPCPGTRGGTPAGSY